MKKITCIGAAALYLFAGTATAQFDITPPKWYPAVKYATLYVSMGDTTKPHSKQIMNIIRDNWKLCPVAFVKADPSLNVPGNLFLDISSYTRTTQYIRENFGGPGFSKGTTSHNDYYYLSFEAASGQAGKSERGTVARAELYLKTITYGGQQQLEDAFKKDLKATGIKRTKEYSYDLSDPDLKYVYLNGNPGNIKNMIQYVSAQLSAGTTSRLHDEMSSSSEIAKLKQDTLFVANYWYGEDGLPMESLDHDSKPYKITVKYVDDMIAAYPHKIKLIGREELNSRIMNASQDFYYYSYIQSSANKIVSVINGRTGQVIYKEVTKLKYRPTEKDFEKLGETVGK